MSQSPNFRAGAFALPILLSRALARLGHAIVAVFIVLLLAFTASNARAANFTVSKLADTNDNTCDADCSLREAINAANFASTSDTISFGVSGTIRLTSALPPITSQLAINGPAAPGILVSGDANGSGAPNTGDVSIFRINGGGNVTISNLTVSGAFSDGVGSALANFGTLTLNNTTFSGNTNSGSGGGILFSAGTLTINNGTFSNNSGGAIGNGGPLTITNSRFTNNTTTGRGGAINSAVSSQSIAPFTLSISDSVFTGNSAGSDGGALDSNGPLLIARCTFSGNSATGVGRPADEASFGGAINISYTNSAQSGAISISDSTISGNSAPRGGGGLAIDTDDGSNGTAIPVVMTNCTVSGNSALAGGGGIVNLTGTLRLQSVTVTANNATGAANIGDGVASLNDTGIRTEIGNSIISGNLGNDVSSDFVDGGTASTLVSLGFNLIGSGTNAGFTATGDQRNVTNPNLGALANNGGPTQTHLPLAGSPAIDKGNTTLTVDQRGVARPLGTADDIGSVEVGGTVAERGLVVTTLADTIANDGKISLREAVDTANTDGAASAITFAVNGTITLANGELTLADDSTISISGPTAGITVSGNKAGRIFVVNTGAEVTLDALTLRDGLASNGGAINNGGTLTIARSTLTGNVAGDSTGSSAENEGGAIFNDGRTLTITDSTFANNSAGEGGAIRNLRTLAVTNSTLTGNSAITGAAISNGSSSSSGTATITGSTLNNNAARSFGGAIFNAASSLCTVTNSKLTGNSATNSSGSGGAIYNNVQGRVTITGSSLTGNSASGGGAIFNVSALTITGSTLAGNTATSVGGAIYTATSRFTAGQADPIGQTLISNSTLSGNSAGSGTGGAIYNVGGLTRIESSTIAGNSAPSGKGAGVASQGNDTTATRVANSIIADNRTTGGAANSGTDVDLVNGGVNSFVSQGNNAIGDGNGASKFNASEIGVTAAQLNLGALADNGGPTQTRLPGSGSVAIDKGATDLTVDQRGIARPFGAADDIGAVESTVPVNPNRAPSVTNVGVSTNTNVARAFTAAEFDAAFSDPDGQTLQSVRVVTLPTNGSLTLSGTAVTVNQVVARAEIKNLVYTPRANFTGSDSFLYNASDGTAFAATNATVNITVNAAPTALNFGVSIVPKAPLTNETLTATPVIANATGVTFTYAWSVNGTVRPNETTNKLALSKPGNGDKGNRVSVVVTGTRGNVKGTATNFVKVFNSAPTTQNAMASGNAGALISVPVSGADADNDPLTFKRVGGPDNGVGSFTTTNGVTSFNYSAPKRVVNMCSQGRRQPSLTRNFVPHDARAYVAEQRVNEG